jgi:hypothetical protein
MWFCLGVPNAQGYSIECNGIEKLLVDHLNIARPENSHPKFSRERILRFHANKNGMSHFGC